MRLKTEMALSHIHFAKAPRIAMTQQKAKWHVFTNSIFKG